MESTHRLPALLRDLADQGLWNQTMQEDPRIPREVVRQLDPYSYGIHLQESFNTVGEEAAGYPGTWWEEFGHINEPGVKSYLTIGDFGLGSDSPIVLDYSSQPPAVRRLAWQATEAPGGSTNPYVETTSWEIIAPSFEAFAKLIGADRWLDNS